MIFGKNIIYFVKLILYLIGKRTATTTVHFEVIHRNVGLICQNILHLLRVFFYSIRITHPYRVDSDYLSNITILIAILYINFLYGNKLIKLYQLAYHISIFIRYILYWIPFFYILLWYDLVRTKDLVFCNIFNNILLISKYLLRLLIQAILIS